MPYLAWLVEYNKRSFVLRLRSVLKVLHVRSYHLPVGNQVAL